MDVVIKDIAIPLNSILHCTANNKQKLCPPQAIPKDCYTAMNYNDNSVWVGKGSNEQSLEQYGLVLSSDK